MIVQRQREKHMKCHISKRYAVFVMIIFAVSIALLGTPFPSAAEDDCQGCERHAVIRTCENPDLPPDLEEKRRRYHECLEREKLKDDPSVTISEKPDAFAHQRCKDLNPRIDFTNASAIASRIAELHTTPCFHMLSAGTVEAYRERGEREGWGDIIKPRKYEIPEYSFDVVFDAVTEEIFNREGKPGSSLKIDLYYDGDERIFVKTWRTLSSGYSFDSNDNRMFENPDALMRQDAPLHKLLWEFEQTPIRCKVIPDEISLKENETREIILSEFAGETGRSKRFNRIVVKVDEGEILNGEQLASDPKARVFKVGDGRVSIEYRAPDSCGEGKDWLYVYNSCDIASTSALPLAETKARRKIKKKRINIDCVERGWTGTINFEVIQQFECESATEEAYSTHELVQHDQERWQATLNVRMEEIGIADMPVVGGDINVTGTLHRTITMNSETTGTGNFARCGDQRITPGDWHREVQKMTGDRTCSVKSGLTVLFRKSSTPSMDRIRELMDEMRKQMDDPDQFDKLSAESEALMNPANDADVFPIDIRFMIVIDCPVELKVKGHRDDHSACDGTTERTEDYVLSKEVTNPLIILDLKGIYQHGKDGRDTITATLSSTEKRANPTGGSWECPFMTVLKTAHLVLTRHPSH
jgi:hypothetical protein